MADDAHHNAADFHGEGGQDPLAPHLVGDRLPCVPLFPLPNVVLFPGAVLPLHVFERRYRDMTAEALGLSSCKHRNDGRNLVCMCRICPGHSPMDDQPAIFPIGCVGRIVHHECLPDGRWNILLQGLRRVRLLDEHPLGEKGPARLYRRADLEVIECHKAFEIDLGEAREQMRRLCCRPPIAGTPVARQLERLFAGPTPTAQLADLLSFELLDGIDERQRLLEEPDERRRVELLAEFLDRQFPDPASLSCLRDRFGVEDQ